MKPSIVDEHERAGSPLHYQYTFYKGFVKGVLLFTAHVAIILLLLAWFLL